MKKSIIKLAVFFAIVAMAAVSCKDDDDPPEKVRTIMERYITVPVGSSNFGKAAEKYVLAHSYKSHKYWYFIYYMGYVKEVPIMCNTSWRYDGKTPISIKWEKGWSTEKTVMLSMTRSRECTWKTSSTATIGLEIGATVGKEGVASASIKSSISASLSTEYGESISTSNTWETTNSKTKHENEGIEATIGEKGEAPGRYRFAYFGITDVFCLLKVDPNDQYKVVETTVYNCARESSCGWGLDFDPDPNGSFGKTDEGELFEVPNVVFSKDNEPKDEVPEHPGPQPAKTISYEFWFESGKIKGGATKVGGGDEDIYSKKDRSTDWSLQITDVKLLNPVKVTDEEFSTHNGVELKFEYIVTENNGNGTVLKIADKSVINYFAPKESDPQRKVTGFDVQVKDHKIYGTIHGEHNNGRVLAEYVDKSSIGWLWVTIDGTGGDLGNIGFEAGIWLKLFEVNPDYERWKEENDKYKEWLNNQK